jgi:hypothetical protein
MLLIQTSDTKEVIIKNKRDRKKEEIDQPDNKIVKNQRESCEEKISKKNNQGKSKEEEI